MSEFKTHEDYNVITKKESYNLANSIKNEDWLKQYYKDGNLWRTKEWTGLTNLVGDHVWSDGSNIYYSRASQQYKLNGTNWETQKWDPNGFQGIYGNYVWSDGNNIYYSNGTEDAYLMVRKL